MSGPTPAIESPRSVRIENEIIGATTMLCAILQSIPAVLAYFLPFVAGRMAPKQTSKLSAASRKQLAQEISEFLEAHREEGYCSFILTLLSL